MALGTPAHSSSTEHELDIHDSTSASLATLSTANVLEAHTVALPALSNESQLDSHSSVATSTFCPDHWYPLLANPLLFGHLQDWEHPVPLFDEGIHSGMLMLQNNGIYMDTTQSQLAQSHFHLPQTDKGSNQEHPHPYNNQATIPVCFSARPLTGISQGGGSIPTEVAPELNNFHDAPLHAPFRTTRPLDTSQVKLSQLHLPRNTPAPEEKSYDRPGRKPAAPFQPDPFILEESCRRAGGSTFAVDWVISTFKHGVTTEALYRALERREIDEMGFPGGFEPHQAYDGFISKVGARYECGLCKEGKRTRWKHKKDAPRHLRKFHFGLADECKACGKDVFSRAEMKTHRCVRSAKDNFQAEASGA